MIAALDNMDIFIRSRSPGVAGMELAVDGIHCASCVKRIEDALSTQTGMVSARVNLALKRVSVEWRDGALDPQSVISSLRILGFEAYPFITDQKTDSTIIAERQLLRRVAVAGFAAMNIMLLSVSVWSGNLSDISPNTRDYFHWLSALIALPAVAYSGLPFFESAVRALKARSVNMDVPITLGVLLALGMSVVETLRHGEHAYFDGAVMLLFFLLIGRYLDQLMRRRTRDLASNLAALKAETAMRVRADGSTEIVSVASIVPGDLVVIPAGERVAVDGTVIVGTSQIDQSLITGETLPTDVNRNDTIFAGTLNLTGVLKVRVTAAGEGTLLDEIDRLINDAIGSKSQYVHLSDRAARLYAPFVHTAALLTFVGWLWFGLVWQQALIIAITVLIITCPCALGLAIPAVQVAAAASLFREKILLKCGDAIERLAEVGTIVFDKTGTLTFPNPGIANAADYDESILRQAASLAAGSSHPLARVIADNEPSPVPLADIGEHKGQGLSAWVDGAQMRLGSVDWCNAAADAVGVSARYPNASLIAWCHGASTAVFAVDQTIRPGASDVIAGLRARGIRVVIASGDRLNSVSAVAGKLKVQDFYADLRPDDKLRLLDRLAVSGKIAMVGDGLNDAPALAKAHVAISPVSALQIAQTAADFVFLGASLNPVLVAIDVSRHARRLMLQNLCFAVGYNAIAVPIAISGYATPLVAAAAMSGSSIVVVLNALRAAPVALPRQEPAK